ncbi:CLC_0170 family protein [Brevibacillus borstelensis]|uniref:CLC_0170 family protein n=1 Tax=Brevibacillus borstelensis TaxID=45462 RepID=UPI0030C2092D
MSVPLHLGYIYYVVFLSIAAGIAVLRIDVANYESAIMPRERRAAKILGWLNIGLGVLILLLQWLIHSFIHT